MFIEWIATTAKREYMEDYVRKINRGRVGLEKMQDASIIDNANCFRVEGFEEYIKELEYDNIFVRFYTSMVTINKKQVQVNDCLVFSFGDTACNIHKYTLTGTTLKDVPIRFLEYLNADEGEFFAKDKKLDDEYARKFILPNMMPQQRVEYYKLLKEKHKKEITDLRKKQESEMEKVFNLKPTKQTKLIDEKEQ